MGHAEEKNRITNEINALGEAIKAAKSEKKPKEQWEPLLNQMLALKLTYKDFFGEDFKAAVVEVVKEKGEANQEASEKNKEKNAKKAAEKAEKEKKKEENRKERELAEKTKAMKLQDLAAASVEEFGDLPLCTSSEITDKVWTRIEEIDKKSAGKTVTVRGYLQICRVVGKGAFILLRSTLYTIQAVAFECKTIPKSMINFISLSPLESIVDITGVVSEASVSGATQNDVELQLTSFHIVNKAGSLPFLMEDACRPDCGKESDVGAYTGIEKESSDGLVRIGQELRLDYRWLDMRTPANQSIFRIQSFVGHFFRNILIEKDFVEIHTPKLIGGASEGGSDCFKVDYFGSPACLAMSPQLHKQMMCANSGFERVFECGPVFRAENSNTRRHLCEFTGFDLEMAISEHYYEVLDVFSDLFIGIFDGLNTRCKNEIERVREQHPFEDLKYCRPTLRITYAEGCKLLREAGIPQDDLEDLSTTNEKLLGNIVKAKYDTDFFFMDEYPLSVRPFYTMPNAANPKLSNSYDFFIRGQEILSGAQRIHDPELLTAQAQAKGINVDTLRAYIDSFKMGSLPHGGGGIGLERVVMLFLGLPNIRKSSAFPRDPKRLSP